MMVDSGEKVSSFFGMHIVRENYLPNLLKLIIEMVKS